MSLSLSLLAAACLVVALAALALASAVGPAQAGEEERPAYPPTRADGAGDVLHGERVPDPYRWLEDDASPEVEAWDGSQEALVRRLLDAVPERGAWRRRMEEELLLGGIPSLPVFRGGRAWFTHLRPGENQPVLLSQDEARTEAPRVVLDPNPWSAEGTEGFKAWSVSPDGRHVAYERMSKGSEDTTVFVREVASGRDLPDRVPRTKFTSLEWSGDGSGFYYSQKPPPDLVPAGEGDYHSRVRWHRLGSAALDDPIVFGEGRDRLESWWVHRSGDDRHLLLSGGFPYRAVDTWEVEEGADGSRRVVPVVVGHDSRTYVDRAGDRYLLNTDWQAPRRRLLVARRGETQDPSRWTEVYAQEEGVIEGAVAVGEHVVVHVRREVVSHLVVIGWDGTRRGEIALPGPGTVSEGIHVRPGDTRIWFAFESYDRPPGTWVVDLAEPGWPRRPVDRAPTTIDVDALATTPLSFPSKDGTRIPVFLLHRKDRPPDGAAPVVLYGYGGFRVGLYPSFRRGRALWAERGGVFAFACLRGGDEFGESWHEAGSLANKQNVFDDFIAVADGLVATGRANRERLAVWGGSNGGLLVAAVANQRPDLCRAVLCGVPLTDMLRYHRFQYARMWAAEYGDPDDEQAFRWIRPWSPYHNVRDGAAYPAALVTAGLNDSRVNAFHARKIAARWQAATSAAAPILLSIDRQGGHGAAGLDRAKAELLDQLSFLEMTVGRGVPWARPAPGAPR